MCIHYKSHKDITTFGEIGNNEISTRHLIIGTKMDLLQIEKQPSVK
jgi:hypothetical protein